MCKKFRAGNVSEHSKNTWCKSKDALRLLFTFYKVSMTDTNSWNHNLVADLRLKLYGMLTLFWTDFSLFVFQKSQNICQREFT